MRIEEVRTIKLNFFGGRNSPEYSHFHVRVWRADRFVYDLIGYEYDEQRFLDVVDDITGYLEDMSDSEVCSIALDVADCLNYLIDNQTLETDWDALMAEALEKFPAAAKIIKKYLVTMGGDDD